jgi:hypothetical protein
MHAHRLALVAALAVAAPAYAQHPMTPEHGAAHAAAKPAERVVGRWEGTYASHGPNGNMTLVVARDTALKADVTFTADQPFAVGPAAAFAVNGSDVTWTQTLMGFACRASGVLDDAGRTLKGDMDCGHAGLSFVLTKK